MRVTLDCHLHLADELQVPDGQLWRHMDQGLESGGICSFPYGILEIKLQDAAPPFIQSLLDSGMLVEVRFTHPHNAKRRIHSTDAPRTHSGTPWPAQFQRKDRKTV